MNLIQNSHQHKAYIQRQIKSKDSHKSFKRARVVNVKVTDADRDQLHTIALDDGADDVIEPSMDDEAS
ncbi:hypothetical protein L1987_32800 [Smallanthus sonchifolius]|uniref:Uncharacterized protein n=1 Tax=Smallanthus sonchifolius TaxID=185202 RepID=A0ACB9HP09_9ASTR|nr:hypothetical protein L1987_32800 [Smallanthus sonchifolius]